MLNTNMSKWTQSGQQLGLLPQTATWHPLIKRTLIVRSLLQTHTKGTSNLNGTTCYLSLHVSSCPRKFTKLMKPVFATLRQLGHLSSGYIDDLWLMGPIWDDCA